VTKLVLALMLSLIPHIAGAITMPVNLTVSNEDLGLPLGTVYATVEWDVVGTTATFTIDVNNDVLTGGPNFGIQDFYFNTNITTLGTGDFKLPSGWGVSFIQQADGFGSFDVNTGDAPAGGQNRYDPVTFTITDDGISSIDQFFFLSELPAGHGQGHFGAHIAGFDPLNFKTSSFFRDGESYTSVSAPASLLLSILGLGTLPFLRRA
jgi:hypothetical protein